MAYKISAKTEKRKSEKRSDIIDAAAALFEANGYSLTTVKDIAEAANISIGTFYLHFKNKESLLENLYDRFISSLQSVSDY
ncbi:MAG TPA: hypothetical protein DCP97_02730, partial [Ruminococcaceae bacterium]|nr:hypothetical protein [Oscillospiraceae bacterium]